MAYKMTAWAPSVYQLWLRYKSSGEKWRRGVMLSAIAECRIGRRLRTQLSMMQ